jgi:hypothetical protein
MVDFTNDLMGEFLMIKNGLSMSQTGVFENSFLDY